MIDIWFKEDLRNIYKIHPVAVVIDETGDADFLIRSAGVEYTIYEANSEIEELYVKYLIEKALPSENKFLVYTRTPREMLKFVREYCETNGCLEIRNLSNYVKQKVHQTLSLNINFPKEELIAAAKVSIGKDCTYWMDLIHKGATEIFNLKKELLPFVHEPEVYMKDMYDEQLCEIFYRKVNELVGQEYIQKPAVTLATEVMKSMLDGLAMGQCKETLTLLYVSCLDSLTYRDSFKNYLSTYSLPPETDIWQVSPDHPFRQIDEKWLAALGGNISNKTTMLQMLAKVRQRHQSKQAQALGIVFWQDVIVLLEFDPQNVMYLGSLNECIEFYKTHFYKLDSAIRNLYTEFLNKQELLEPWQELYKEYVSIFLDKWFSFWQDYQETQSGTLQRIIDENHGVKVAVIVSDGVTYEIAEQVANKVKGHVHLQRQAILADIPSETENNMSRIFMNNRITEHVQREREKYLIGQNPSIAIDFMRLDELNEEALQGQVLICTYKDIDDLGEKLQQKALKYFSETIDFFAEKISLLLDNGYTKVYLISDHGFVLTGLLNESDKIAVDLQDEFYKTERYIRTVARESALTMNLIETEKKHKQFQYLYVAKNINPFKTPGLYGFSHGGASPQELITPFFCWEQERSITGSLQVQIAGKDILKDISGEFFSLSIQADHTATDLFSMDRKVYLVFFADKKQVNKSDILTINRGERISKEYAFDGSSTLEVHLLDALTKQQLDRAVIKKNQDRDLGGLL